MDAYLFDVCSSEITFLSGNSYRADGMHWNGRYGTIFFFLWTQFENLDAEINVRVIPIAVAKVVGMAWYACQDPRKVTGFAQCVVPCRLNLTRLFRKSWFTHTKRFDFNTGLSHVWHTQLTPFTRSQANRIILTHFCSCLKPGYDMASS